MIRLLLILVLAGPVWNSSFETYEDLVPAPGWDSSDTSFGILQGRFKHHTEAEHYAAYMMWALGNSARSAHLMLGDFPWLPDLDAYIDTDTIQWEWHQWCWPHPLPGGWRCFTAWIQEERKGK